MGRSITINGQAEVTRPWGVIGTMLFVLLLSAVPGAGEPSGGRRDFAKAETSMAPMRASALQPRQARSLPPPTVTSVAPAVLRPGMQATIAGTGFSPQLNRNLVRVAGVPVKVLAASRTELTVQLPLGGFDCLPVRPVVLSVRVGNAAATTDHPLQSAEMLELSPGEVATPGAMGFAHCVELAQAGGRYLVGVVNAMPDDRSRSFMLLGTPGREQGAPLPAVVRDTGLVPSTPRAGRALPVPPALDTVRAAAQVHIERLRSERTRIGALGPSALRFRGAGRAKPVPRVGDVEIMRMQTVWNDCASYDEVPVRVAFVGEHSIILVDTASPVAGKLNAEFQSLGTEFETVMLPILEANFGSPLAMDPFLDQDGRVRMFFSHRVQQLKPKIYGFVTVCDFHEPVGSTASSNEGEVFYATLPGTVAETAAWLRTARPTVIHEVKHLVSYAERIWRGGEGEVAWLEEGTAMVAEELYARTFTKAAQHGNVSYAVGVECDFTPDQDHCAGRPASMGDHFDALYQYMAGVDTLSPLLGGWHTYGTGWSLARWAADVSSVPEPGFFSSLTRAAGFYGSANLAKQSGRPFEELIVDWHMAAALDDNPDLPSGTHEHSMRSWNTRDVYQGLHGAYVPPAYALEFPLVPGWRHFGDFQVRFWALPNASASFTEIGGTQWATQILELKEFDGSALPDDTGLRMAIARVW